MTFCKIIKKKESEDSPGEKVALDTLHFSMGYGAAVRVTSPQNSAYFPFLHQILTLPVLHPASLALPSLEPLILQ